MVKRRRNYSRKKITAKYPKPTIIGQLIKLLFASDPEIRNYSLYALRTRGGKYYVGMTAYRDTTRRTNQHGTRKGARWTRRFRPIEVIEIRRLGRISKLEALNLENDMTQEYMRKYGKQNVRGGRMVQTGFVLFSMYNPVSLRGVIQSALIASGIFLLVVTFLSLVISSMNK